MCTCRSRKARYETGGPRRLRVTPARINASIAAALCVVVLFPSCAGATAEQRSAQESRAGSSVASAHAAAPADADLDTAAAVGCGLRIRLVGEAMDGSASTHVQSSILTAVHDAYLEAVGLRVEAAIVPAKSVGGANGILLHHCCSCVNSLSPGQCTLL